MTARKTVKKSKKISGKKLQRGTVGNFFVFGILALLMVLGITAVGGLPSQQAPTTGEVVNVITPTPGQNYSNLQLKSFGYVTIAPTPTPAKASLCNNAAVNDEPEILVGFSPGAGQSVGSNGQVKVWVNDEGAPFIAPGEQIDDATGAITTPGNRGAKSGDGYLYEPALYVDSATAESGGAAHFPDLIKGQFNNQPPTFGHVVDGPVIDPVPANTTPTGQGPFGGGGFGFNIYTAEYIWNVSSLGLATGTHQAEFVIHDGDVNRGVGCVSINIQ